jgi:hypothetical protein
MINVRANNKCHAKFTKIKLCFDSTNHINVFRYFSIYKGNRDLDLLNDLICPCCDRKNFSVELVGT